MLTDDDLRQVVESAASAAPAPRGLDMSTFAVDVDPRQSHSRRPQVLAIGIAAAMLVAVIIGASALSSRPSTKAAATFSAVPNSGTGAGATAAGAQSSSA